MGRSGFVCVCACVCVTLIVWIVLRNAAEVQVECVDVNSAQVFIS